MSKKSRFLHGQSIQPPAIDANISIVDLVDQTFNAYNAARFREACHLFTERMLQDDVTIGMSLSGAMTPAGLGMAAIIPLMRAVSSIGLFLRVPIFTTTLTSESDSRCGADCTI